jgi:integrase
MRQRKQFSQKAGRVVRYRLADGRIKEYRYKPCKPSSQLTHEAKTIGALIEAYERSPEWLGLAEATRTTYSIYLRDLLRLQHAQVTAIKRQNLMELRDAIAVTRGRGAATGFMRSASAVFGWAVDRGMLEHSPAHRIKQLKGGHLPAWSEADAELAMRHLSEPLRRAVLLALYTGQRRGDLVRLTWAAYDEQAIRLRQQKTGEALVIPVHPALKRELDAWRAGNANAVTILTNDEGEPWHPIRLSERMHRALDKIPGFPEHHNIHGLRKLAAAKLADAGCTVHEIAAITGHRTLSMVQLYTRSADQERLAGAAIVKLRTGKDTKPYKNANKQGESEG